MVTRSPVASLRLLIVILLAVQFHDSLARRSRGRPKKKVVDGSEEGAHKSDCPRDYCSGHGFCFPAATHGNVPSHVHRCVCNKNYVGTRCEKYSPPATTTAKPRGGVQCGEGHCANGGTCELKYQFTGSTISPGGVYLQYCKCTSDYEGDWCERMFGEVHGGWSSWSEEPCVCGRRYPSVSSRKCNNPAPVNGGRECEGSKHMADGRRHCNLQCSTAAPATTTAKPRGGECKYMGRGREGNCNQDTNTKLVTVKIRAKNKPDCAKYEEVPMWCDDLTRSIVRPRGWKPKCKYSNRGREGNCNQDTNIKLVTVKLRKKNKDPDCAKSVEVPMWCEDYSRTKKPRKKKCKYNHKAAIKSPCYGATHLMTITSTLKAHQDKSCAPKKIKTQYCR